jgi:hypothetical protein
MHIRDEFKAKLHFNSEEGIKYMIFTQQSLSLIL